MPLPKLLSRTSRNRALTATLLGLCLLLFAFSASGQERYQVGQKVEFYCACYGGRTSWRANDSTRSREKLDKKLPDLANDDDENPGTKGMQGRTKCP
jgi:hypothetical protein